MSIYTTDKRRSFSAVTVEMLLRITGRRNRYKKSGYDKYMRKLDNEKYTLPNVRFRSTVEKSEFCGIGVYSLSKTDSPDRVILYLHGGAYINQPLSFHWRGCDKIVQATNAKLVMPIYPLVPHGNCELTYGILLKLYSEIAAGTDKPIVLMGDSAGGGLAFGFCQYLRDETDLPQPSMIIGLSPWVDVTMTNPKMPEYEPKDPMLAIYGAAKMGELWAGDLDPKDYRVSPIYGNVEGLPRSFMFVGTREVLYPDIAEFYQKLTDKNVECDMYVVNGMNHVYPLFPIKEAKLAVKQISEIILRG